MASIRMRKKNIGQVTPSLTNLKKNRKRRDAEQILYNFLQRGFLTRRDHVVLTLYWPTEAFFG